MKRIRSRHFWGAALLLTAAAGVVVRAVDDPPARKVHIVAERFHFTPAEIKARKGELLEIEITSDDTYHGFRLPVADLNLTVPARGGGSVRLTFRAHETGSYPFECSRPCGAGHTMMRGVIRVE